MVKHLKIKNKCRIINSDTLLLSEEEIMEKSIRKINEYGEIIEEEEKKHQCENCKKKFSRKYTLDKHKENVCNKTCTTNNNYNTTINNITNTTINNITNNTQNITNNINLNLNVIKGFDEEWDISKIDYDKMMLLLLSNNKFTNTLKEILKNEVNLNVLFIEKSNKDKEVCNDIYIFNKNKQKFEQSKKEEIIKKSMEKLYNNLNYMINKLGNSKDIPEYLKEEAPQNIVREGKKTIDIRYNNFKSDRDVKKHVSESITEIFKSKTEETQKVHKSFNKLDF